MKPFDEQLVSGSIVRSVWKLAWPAVALNLVNGVHGIIDHLLVGNIMGYEANAAIGCSWQIFIVVIVFVASLFQGMSVLLARYSGKQDRETVANVAYHTFLASIVFLVFIAGPLGYIGSEALLDLVKAAPEVQIHALPYIRILFVCGAPLLLMHFINSAMFASGDARVPLKLGVVTAFLNVVLSVFLITGLGPAPKMGAPGAGLATCIAPIPSIVVALGWVARRKTIIQPPRRFTLVPDLSILARVVRIGLPTGLQAISLHLAGVFLLRLIGSLEHSAAAQGAYTICFTQLFAFVMWPAFGLRVAASTVIGQNIGAGDVDRGSRGVYIAGAMGLVWAAVVGLAYWIWGPHLLALFDATEEPVLGYGVSFLRYLSFAGLAMVLTMAFTGGLIGAGETRKPMYIAFVSQILVLLGLCYLFAGIGRLSTDAIWFAVLASHTVRCLLSYVVFRRGKWRGLQIEFDA